MRLRVCDPVPHDMVQTDHPPHWACLLVVSQSSAQHLLLHSRVSVANGHAYPPSLWADVTERERLWRPPVPHDLVHGLHALNADIWQCVAQFILLQLRVSSRYGHK